MVIHIISVHNDVEIVNIGLNVNYLHKNVKDVLIFTMGEVIRMNSLERDFDCTCEGCFNNVEFNYPKSHEELRTAKITELAEQEGGLKAYITQCLEQFPNYNQICDCKDRKVGHWLVEDLGDSQYRNICTLCGGIIIG